MSTLSDVMEFRVFVWQACELHGSTAEFQEEFARRFLELGETIRTESGYTIAEAKKALNLYPRTEFGPLAEAKFQELKDWVFSLNPFNSIPK